MILFRVPIMVVAMTVLAACASSTPSELALANNLYCGNFLIYNMCAQDLDEDGIVELVYFEDTKEVFLVREGADMQLPTHLSMHDCAQAMDERLINATSKMFYITDNTSFLEITDIKTALLLSYISNLPAATDCNAEVEISE
ncbi:MAG: hypothetical protein V3T43_01980 [Nitrosomonadaceae bacterium]